MEVKIFELRHDDEKEWIGATHVLQAIRFYNEHTDLKDLDEDAEIVEIPKEEWAGMMVGNPEYDPKDENDWYEKSFADFVKEDGGVPPFLIAGTFYD